SMYVLNKFYSNALYTSDEIARLAYQTSPLNFQAYGGYIRSEATAFVEALRKNLPIPPDGVLPGLEYVLARNMDFSAHLGQMFGSIAATPAASGIQARLETVVGAIARDLVQSGSLGLSKDPHQRALTFVDVSEILKTNTSAIDAKLRTCVTEY